HALVIGVWGWGVWSVAFLPALLFSFLWYELINLTHHAGLYHLNSRQQAQPLALHEQVSVCRSARMPTALSWVLCYHFNLHTEHHLFPTVPWHHLPKVQALLDAQGLPDYIGVDFPGFNQALRNADPVEILLNRLPEALATRQRAGREA
ncbi:MAG: fatty acid desaturase, partial [Gammaproteobacteria bacterium]|nr:fatty acid desaturase [Gammaproteobacteria bacterium]